MNIQLTFWQHFKGYSLFPKRGPGYQRKAKVFGNFGEFLKNFEHLKKNFRAFLGEVPERIFGHVLGIMSAKLINNNNNNKNKNKNNIYI